MLQPADQPMTFADVARLNADEQPGELEAGRWVPVTRSTWRHGCVVLNIGALLKAYTRAHAGWSVATADPGVKLKANPDTLRGPDVGMIRAERQPSGKGVEGWLSGAPDLVVEVAGDSQTTTEMVRKALDYLNAGAQMVWIVDPDPQRVLVMTPPDHVRVLGPEDALDGGDLLPGFSCQVGEFFE